jgi:hypothetical protein
VPRLQELERIAAARQVVAEHLPNAFDIPADQL